MLLNKTSQNNKDNADNDDDDHDMPQMRTHKGQSMGWIVVGWVGG